MIATASDASEMVNRNVFAPACHRDRLSHGHFGEQYGPRRRIRQLAGRTRSSGVALPPSERCALRHIDGLGLRIRSTTDTFTLYLVDTSRAVIIETDDTELTLGYLQLQE